jgi:hypothetical protein
LQSAFFSASGGTVTYSGSYTIHTFTANGTFTVNNVSKSMESLVVGGGGSGGTSGPGSYNSGGGGGGGGGVSSSTNTVSPGNHAISIGGTGSGSSFASFNTVGGGSGGEAVSSSSAEGRRANGGAGVVILKVNASAIPAGAYQID